MKTSANNKPQNEKVRAAVKHVKRNWQRYAFGVLAAIFSFLILFRLGDFSMPDSYFHFAKKTDSSGAAVKNEVIIKLTYNPSQNDPNEVVLLDRIWLHTGSSNVKKSSSATMRFSYALSETSSTWHTNLGDKKGAVTFSDASGNKNYRMYRWTQAFENVEVSKSYCYFKLSTTNGIYLNEIVFLDKNGSVIPAEVVSGDPGAEKLLDEQHLFSYRYEWQWEKNDDGTWAKDENGHYIKNLVMVARKDRMNCIIFDEYYFARTAFDFLQGDAAFVESSHPPLGKLFLAIGIGIFGMNTFGMRIMPALFAIATLFVMYALGKRLFKGSKTMGFLFALLYAISGINIALGRIGTTDTFLVFFVSLSYYYLLVFLQNGIDRKRCAASYIPLVLSGVFFGCGAAVKWSGITAGIGHFVIFAVFFFYRLICNIRRVRAMEGKVADTAPENTGFFARVGANLKAMWGTEEGEEASPQKPATAAAIAAEKRYVWIESAFSVLFAGLGFLVLAFSIYLISYLIAGNSYCALYEVESPFAAFLKNQEYIFGFHTSKNFAWTDPNISPWWGWPIAYQSSCFSVDTVADDGLYIRSHCIGTISVFLMCFMAFIYLTLQILCTVFAPKSPDGEVRYSKRILRPYLFLLAGFLCTWLPWAVVDRPMYTYTFLPSSFFYLGFLALFIYAALTEWKKPVFKGLTVGGLVTIALLFVGAINFLLFYPYFAGLPVSDVYATVMFSWSALHHTTFTLP